MDTVRKFTTFDKLKACENKEVKFASILKKLNAFEIIKAVALVKAKSKV